jgi:MoaA/NifB/PqqE/SkfB family radical SAM enzyme
MSVNRAHWNILTDCNLSCGFCYLWRRPEARVWTTAESLNLIKALSTRIEVLVFGGGDPLMRDDLIELVTFAKGVGLRVEMHTNAERIEEIDSIHLFQMLDRLGLSIDGEDELVHDAMRSTNGNFQKCITALNVAQMCGVRTTVRTLVTKRNVGRIHGIPRILSAYPCVEKWSIRQFVPLGRGAKTEKFYDLGDDAFAKEAKSALEASSHYEISVVSKEDMTNCFCLITEDGVFYGHPTDNAYKAVGKFPEETLEKIFGRLTYNKRRGAEAYA